LLVIAPDRAVSSALKRLLVGAGYEVWVAEDVLAAAALTPKIQIDLAVMDLDALAGCEAPLIEAWCQPAAAFPILILTQLVEPRSVKEAAQLGGVLDKRVDAGLLLATVNRLLEQSHKETGAPELETRALILYRLRARGARLFERPLPYRRSDY
jgi:DNA-binding response OmpR family regulator